MSEPAPENLVPIEAASTVERSSETEGPPDPERRTPWLLILLGLGLVVMTGLFVSQMRRADGLEAEVVRLAGELQASRQTVAAYKGHLGEVRSQVGDLTQQMQTLQDLVELDPEASQAPPEGPTGSSQAP